MATQSTRKSSGSSQKKARTSKAAPKRSTSAAKSVGRKVTAKKSTPAKKKTPVSVSKKGSKKSTAASKRQSPRAARGPDKQEFNRLAALLKLTSGALMVVDTDLVVQYVNQATMDLFAAHQESFRKLFPGFDPSTIVGTNIDRFHATPAHQRRLLADPRNLPFKTDITIGSAKIQLHVHAMLDAAGDPNGYALEWADVTALRDSAGQLAAIQKSQAVIEFSMDGTVQNANQNFLDVMGYRLEDVVGRHHAMFVEPSHANSMEYRQFWKRLNEGQYAAGEYKRIAADGREVWLQSTYNPICDLNGQPFKVVKYATDITVTKEMGFAIEERQKADAEAAAILKANVAQILDAANRVAKGDYSTEISVCGEDAIGQLGEGLKQVFAHKRMIEDQDRDRAENDRREAESQRQKVNQILAVVNAVAEGNFDLEVPDLGNDSVGQVAKALGVAIDSMRSALQAVRRVSTTVSTAASDVNSASSEISSGAQHQASSLEETASSLEEITTTVKLNSDNAQQARQLANGSRDVAEKGGLVVSEAVKAMSEINHASTRIADIITTIDEIAFQTNLLALNAAVEAARAGEQGGGFAVVAAEVRNLAQRSALAAKEIKTLIQDSVRKVENGTSLVNQSGKTLEEIVTSVKRVTDIVAEIAAASQEQLTGIEQVNKAVAQMDHVTQNNASQTEEMAGTAESLLSHSEELTNLVARFHLPAEGEMVATTVARKQHPSSRRSRPPAALAGTRMAEAAAGATLDHVGQQIDRLVNSGFIEF